MYSYGQTPAAAAKQIYTYSFMYVLKNWFSNISSNLFGNTYSNTNLFILLKHL